MANHTAKEYWKRFFTEQFHYSKFCFVHRDERAFIYSPWLPQHPKYQVIYLIYRWSVALYFLGWLIGAGATTTYGPKFLIYLTYWNFMIVTGHHLFSALSCTYGQIKAIVWNIKFQTNPVINKNELTISDIRDRRHYIKECCLCCPCGTNNNTISWYHIVMWIGHTLSSVVPIPIIVFYWGIIATNHITAWAVNLNIHLIVGIPGIVDGLVTGIPWRLYHCYVPMVLGIVYFIFSLIYDLVGGTNHRGNPYIYSATDYSENPVTAVGFIFLLVFIVAPIIHFIFWCLHVLRSFLLYHKLKDRQNVEVGREDGVRTRKTSQQPFLNPVLNDNNISGSNYKKPATDLGVVNEAMEDFIDSAPTSPTSPTSPC